MMAGLVAMTVVWGWSLPIAFTWYVFIGAVVTVIVAWAVHFVQRTPSPA
jgi:hypothetical protein